MTLPTGTITFLFTDIEGSTKLWEEQPDTMRLALARHDALLRAAIETNGGTVFKTMGDAFCAAFSTAPQALEAALSAQQSLRQVKAGVGADLMLKVRMALHTGTVEQREGDYFGRPLNRIARLLSAGNGGQILLSQTTYDLTRDVLPTQAGCKDLGQHRLKDLARPDQVYQLLHPDLPSDFPPLRSLDNPTLPNNLPQQVTSFIGREKEIEDIRTILATTRLLTLTGSGGCGKTRLSLQVAAEVLETYPDGVWLVEFAPLSDPALVPQTVADVLRVREIPGELINKTLMAALKEKSLLLVLDNCEHLLEAAARLADTLLRSCPKVRMLISSREALGIAGESAYRVPSLSVPDLKQPQTPQILSQYESVSLFLDRAVAAKADFLVTNQNAPALASVCHRLDGIPLAIELAAARIRSMTVEELGHRLDDRFRILTGGSRTALPRQQTLRAMIDWSYDLLEENQKALFTRLCVFLGGWTLEAAERVCSGGVVEAWEMLDLLTALCDKSLVMTEEEGETTRYRLLETVRQYARERLASEAEGSVYRLQHRDYFLALAEEADAHILGAEQSVWLQRLEEEHENLRAALEGSLGEGESGGGLRLCGALQKFWWTRGYLSEGREWCGRALGEAGAQERTPERAKALNGAGGLARMQGDYASARAYIEESLSLFREIGDRGGVADSLINLGIVAYSQGDYASARLYLEESQSLFREIGNRGGIAASINNLGLVAYHQGDYASARANYEESLSLFREIGDRGGVADSLNNLGLVASAQDDYASARAYLEESLSIYREIGSRRGIANSLIDLGNEVSAQDDYASARTYYEESLTIQWEIGDRMGVAVLLEVFAGLAAVQEQTERAAQLWGSAEAPREEIGSPLPPKDREEYDRDVPAARASVGEEAFTAAWEEGRAMMMEQAIELALKKDPADA